VPKSIAREQRGIALEFSALSQRLGSLARGLGLTGAVRGDAAEGGYLVVLTVRWIRSVAAPPVPV
jgi:hypothetical protein